MLFCIRTSEKPDHLYTTLINGIVLQVAVYGVRKYLIKGTFLLKIQPSIYAVVGAVMINKKY